MYISNTHENSNISKYMYKKKIRHRGNLKNDAKKERIKFQQRIVAYCVY